MQIGLRNHNEGIRCPTSHAALVVRQHASTRPRDDHALRINKIDGRVINFSIAIQALECSRKTRWVLFSKRTRELAVVCNAAGDAELSSYFALETRGNDFNQLLLPSRRLGNPLLLNHVRASVARGDKHEKQTD